MGPQADIAAQQTSADALAASLPELLIRADRVSASILHGTHGRRRAGQGEDFWQFRPFQYGEGGDDPGTIDWRQSARGDAYYVREQEWEAAQTLWFWCDSSVQMGYQSDLAAETKRSRALLIALTLASLASRRGERLGLWGQRRPRQGRSGYRQLAKDLHTAEMPLLESKDVPRSVSSRDLHILISDFLHPIEKLSEVMHHLHADRGRALVIQVLDPAEQDWPFEGRTEFESLSSGPGSAETILLSQAGTVRQAYQTRFQNHHAALQALCAERDWPLFVHRTDHGVTPTLLSLHTYLTELAPQAGRGQT